MAILKCKSCGANLNFSLGDKITECEYCGNLQTFPNSDDDRKLMLLNRATELRIDSEFDKACGIYETVAAEFPDEAEAYWGLVLCKYGIEYVSTSAFNRVPTCHRTNTMQIFNDKDYKAAYERATVDSRLVYEKEAKVIDEIQKKIIAVANKEEPYDIFICYKENDQNHIRTEDSTIAQDIYTELIKQGYKVFLARVSLNEYGVADYEPHIFAALSSARVMITVATKLDYINSAWVKNEWSRFISMMNSGKPKHLIPCIKNFLPEEMPPEFGGLQALNIGDVMFYKSLMSRIRVAFNDRQDNTDQKQTETKSANTSSNLNIDSLLTRAFMFLEDGDWESAHEYCEKVLDIDPKNVMAYLGNLMADIKIRKRAYIKKSDRYFSDNKNYQKIQRFGDDEIKNELAEALQEIGTRNENAINDDIYNEACENMKMNSVGNYRAAIELFDSILYWKDSCEKMDFCEQRIEELLEEQAERERREREREREEEEKLERLEREAEEEFKRNIRKEKIRSRIIAVTVTSVVCIIIAAIVLSVTVIIPKNNYNKAVELMEDGKTTEAIEAFIKTNGYKDSGDKSRQLIAERDVPFISAGEFHTVALKSDGTVVATGDNSVGQCNISDWKDIIAISAGDNHTVGLKSDGTVVAVGRNDEGQCNVEDWKDIIAISAGRHCTIGLNSNGKVVAVGQHGTEVGDWENIIAISAGGLSTVGLKTDGTVVAAGYNYDGELNVGDWNDIVAISKGGHTAGLKSNGTVAAVGDNDNGECNVEAWTDIVAIGAGENHTVGLKSDGTVVAIGQNDNGQCNVNSWSDMVAISAGKNHTVGLKSDGTVVAVGYNGSERCNVKAWKDIKTPESQK